MKSHQPVPASRAHHGAGQLGQHVSEEAEVVADELDGGVDLMGDAARQPAERFQLLRQVELLGQLTTFGDVFHEGDRHRGAVVDGPHEPETATLAWRVLPSESTKRLFAASVRFASQEAAELDRSRGGVVGVQNAVGLIPTSCSALRPVMAARAGFTTVMSPSAPSQQMPMGACSKVAWARASLSDKADSARWRSVMSSTVPTTRSRP